MCDISPELASNIKNWASHIPEVKGVILFGSRVRGTANQSSDWDICIEVEDSQSHPWLGIWIDKATIWKQEFCKVTGLRESEVQFVSFTSETVKSGIRECSKYLYKK